MIKDIIQLTKVKITVAVTLSMVAGWVLAANSFSVDLILPTLGLFILASGSAALNQFQEHELDALMERTKNRPIPSGRMSAKMAAVISVSLIVIGSFLLYWGGGLLEMELGLITMIWYNGIYTKLKRKTAFAVIPGSIIGALPPAIGYVAGGGALTDPAIWGVAFFFFVWQIPHFWLLILMHGKQYENAGFPSLTAKYSTEQIEKITYVWVVSAAVSSLLILFFGAADSIFSLYFLPLWALLLTIISAKLFITGSKVKYFAIFMQINVFLLGIMAVIVFDNL